MFEIANIISFLWKWKEEILGMLIVAFIWWYSNHQYNKGYAQAKLDVVAESVKEAGDIRRKQNEISAHRISTPDLANRVRLGTY